MIGEEIKLKLLNEDDVDQNYLDWMNDSEVVQYLESRWISYTLEDLREYVKNVKKSDREFLLGVFDKKSSEHIGNVKIGDINWIHRFGSIGIVIGKKDYWGKGIGTEAIRLATKYAFSELNLNKLIAGVYENNIGSQKIFEKNGYRKVGVYKNHRFCGLGEGNKIGMIDEYIYELLRSDFKL